MKLLLVRHGESASNRRDFARMLREGPDADDAASQEATAWAAADEAAAEPNGDTFLTENGIEQVEAFGTYWAPILCQAAQRGNLRVVCSPMRRNLQTAAPLLRELDRLGCPVIADVRRDNFEVPGMIHPDDVPVTREVERLVNSGDVQAAVKLMKGHAWIGAGLSKREIAAEFPHTKLMPGDSFPSDPNEGWYKGGYEGKKLIRRRFAAMADWVEGMRDALGPHDVVLMVTHGDMQNRLLNVLLARQMGLPDFKNQQAGGAVEDTYVGWHPGSNTSVTMVTMNKPRTFFRNANGFLNEGAIFNIEFSHRLDHLSPENSPTTNTLMRGYIYTGLMPPKEGEDAVGVSASTCLPSCVCLSHPSPSKPVIQLYACDCPTKRSVLSLRVTGTSSH